MIPNQFRRPSADVMEIVQRLLDDGRVNASIEVMRYGADVVQSEREQLRADRDAARAKLMACGMAAATRPIFDAFGHIANSLRDFFIGLQKPHSKSDYAKVN